MRPTTLLASLDQLLVTRVRRLLVRCAVVPGMDPLLRAVRAVRTRVVLLDARCGGTARRAVEAIPLLLCRAPVVVLTPTPSQSERAEALALGAAAVVDCYDDAELALLPMLPAMVERRGGRRVVQ